MGMIEKAVNAVIDSAAKEAGKAAVEGTLAAVEATAESAKAVGGFVSDKIGKVIERRNLADLKKQAKKQKYCLFVTKEEKLGPGIYKVVNKKKEEKYNTLSSFISSRNYILRLYTKQRGEIASFIKSTNVEKGLFKSKTSVELIIDSTVYPSGRLIETQEGDQKVYKTDFNDWIITGDFETGNYKIFNMVSGDTVATVSKKYKSASTFAIDCEFDKNEPIIVLITIFIDIGK